MLYSVPSMLRRFLYIGLGSTVLLGVLLFSLSPLQATNNAAVAEPAVAQTNTISFTLHITASTVLTDVMFGSFDAGDIDNDGDNDILLTGCRSGGCAGADRVSKLYMNDGNGNFTEDIVASGVLTPLASSSVDLGDMDGDGDLDLLMAGFDGTGADGQQTLVYKNHNGTFVNLNAGLTGVENGSVAWGQLDADGDLDIVVTGLEDGAQFLTFAEVYENNGDDTFTGLGTGLTGIYKSAVAWGDFDGANTQNQDLLLSGSTGFFQPDLTKLYQNNSGTFVEELTASGVLTDVSNSSIDWADMDNDGDLDILFAGQDTNNINIVTVFKNFDGVYTRLSPDLPQLSEASVDWADMEGDGDLDILLSGNDPNTFEPVIAVYENVGGDTFTYTMASAVMTGISGGQASWVDIDNDCVLDIVISGGDSSFNPLTNVYKNLTPPFSLCGELGGNEKEVLFAFNQSIGSSSDDTSEIALADIDGDGDLDLIAGNTSEVSKVYLNDKGTFGSGTSLGTSSNDIWRITLGDIDGDNDLDLVTAGDGSQFNRVYINNNGTFDDGTNISSDRDDTWGIALGDIDDDGDLDLVTGNNDKTANKIYLNNGGVFTNAIAISPDLDSTNDIALGDIDGNGDLDIIAGNNGSPSKVYLNTGGQFDNGTEIPNSDDVWRMVLGDIDGDGDLDMVTASSFTSRLNKVYINNNGVFASGVNIGSENDDTWGLALEDIDGDGDLDLFTGNYQGVNKLYLYDNGAFAEGTAINPNSNNTNQIALGDIDGDGDLDLAAANYNAASAMYLNISTPRIIAEVTPGAGGTITSTDETVLLDFPAGVVPNNTTVEIQLTQLITYNPPTYFQPGFYLDITATDDTSGDPVTQFEGNFTFTYSYNEEELVSLGIRPETLNIYFYDTDLGRWVVITEGRAVDTEAKTISVQLDHLTEFGIFGSGSTYIPLITTE